MFSNKRARELEAQPQAKKIPQVYKPFDDTNKCMCARCGAATNKPPLTFIATMWNAHNMQQTIASTVFNANEQSNIYHYLPCHIESQMVNTELWPVISTNNSTEIHPYGKTPIQRNTRQCHFYTSYPAESFVVEDDESVEIEDPRDAIFTSDGFTLRRSQFVRDISPLNTGGVLADTNYTINMNKNIIRFGDLIARRAARPYLYEAQAFVPVGARGNPFDIAVAYATKYVSCGSSAWFKTDFVNKAIIDPLIDLNRFPDYLIRGLVDVYYKAENDIHTEPFCQEGVFSDKMLFVGHKEFGKRLISDKEVEAVRACRYKNRSHVDGNDTEGDNLIVSDMWLYDTLITECAHQLRAIAVHPCPRKTYSPVVDSVNIYHGMKEWILIPGKCKMDLDRSCITMTPVKEDGMFRLCAVSWEMPEGLEDFQRDKYVSYRNMVGIASDMHWGTHRIYCYDCWKSYGDLCKDGLDGYGNHAAPNYNFFFELHRALPLKLRPLVVANKFSDVDIICQ